MRGSIRVIVVQLCLFLGACQDSDTDDWLAQLPDCPCQNPDYNGVKLNDGWAHDVGDLSKYHYGATESFRSYPSVETSAGNSGQQCCYDKNGQLITSGSGAGTPDKVSTCKGEDEKGVMKTRYIGVLGHYFRDVVPFENAGSSHDAWKKYNLRWKPNQGKGCKSNVL